MFVRILAGLLGIYNGANGFYMLLAPERWFAGVAAATGPFNRHFVQDVGIAFIAAGLAFLVLAWDRRWGLLALGASGFLVGHAMLHIIGWTHGHGSAAESLMIAAPALAGVWVAWPRRSVADA